MALPQAISSTATLPGALRVNYSLPAPAAAEDPGGKISFLISAVNALVLSVSALNTAVSALNAAAVSAANSAVTFSAFSTTPTSSIVLGSYPGTTSNFNSV